MLKLLIHVLEKPSSSCTTVCRICIERIGQISSDESATNTSTQVPVLGSVLSLSLWPPCVADADLPPTLARRYLCMAAYRHSHFWAIVTNNGSPYAMGPLSVLSVCNIGVLWPSSPWKGAQQPPTHFSAHVCCGQTAWWITTTWCGGWRRPRRCCVRWGPSLPWTGAQQPPLFGQCLLWPYGDPSQQLLSSYYWFIWSVIMVWVKHYIVYFCCWFLKREKCLILLC